MTTCAKTVIHGVILSLVSASCKQAYEPKIRIKNTALLVVEGFLNCGQGPTTIRLSRTAGLQDSTASPELDAQVTVEGEDGYRVNLTGNIKGEYKIDQLSLDSNVRYRLHIQTKDGKEYVSGYSAVQHTPSIDSITWRRENDGLKLYANAHDPQNSARYYQWKYEETWEFHSAFTSSVMFVWDSVANNYLAAYRHPDQSIDTTIYKCWKTQASTSIILGSTEKLNSDIVYLPVRYIEPHSEKLSVLYSINLRQYAISHDEYLFLEKMKKNTEELGTLFDPQPSALSGNIRCLTDSNEIAIGFVGITEERARRVFIDNKAIDGWDYNPGCVLVKLFDTALVSQVAADLVPTNRIDPHSFYASTAPCVDCTIGRSNKKPDFWP